MSSATLETSRCVHVSWLPFPCTLGPCYPRIDRQLWRQHTSWSVFHAPVWWISVCVSCRYQDVQSRGGKAWSWLSRGQFRYSTHTRVQSRCGRFSYLISLNRLEQESSRLNFSSKCATHKHTSTHSLLISHLNLALCFRLWQKQPRWAGGCFTFLIKDTEHVLADDALALCSTFWGRGLQQSWCNPDLIPSFCLHIAAPWEARVIFRANCVTIKSKETFFISINPLFTDGVQFYDICQTVLRTPSSLNPGCRVSLDGKIITSKFWPVSVFSSLSLLLTCNKWFNLPHPWKWFAGNLLTEITGCHFFWMSHHTSVLWCAMHILTVLLQAQTMKTSPFSLSATPVGNKVSLIRHAVCVIIVINAVKFIFSACFCVLKVTQS